jgi:hypothetical protein
MTYSQMSSIAEDNAKLLISLIRKLRATDLGSVCGFFEVDVNWCCPSCHRQKQDIARVDKNGNLLCALHWHHDHFGDFAHDKLPHYRDGLKWKDALEYDSLRNSFVRFKETLICADCNVAEGAAKVGVPTPPGFSFTPFEISTFVVVKPNVPHGIDRNKVNVAFEKARSTMALYGDSLRKVMDYDKAEPSSFEQVGGAAWRVLKDIRAKMKAAKGEDTE